MSGGPLLPPVGLVQACDDPDLFGVDLWPAQRRWLEAIEQGPRIHVVAVGRRGGKSLMDALAGLWFCTLRPDLRRHLRPRERGHVVAVAVNLRQSRRLVEVARAIVEQSAVLRDTLESATDDELTFRTGMVFSAFPCTSRGGRGWPVACLIFDELGHFIDSEGNSAAESVWRALTPSVAQFDAAGRVIATSTPWGSSGLFADLHARATSGELEDAQAHHATTAEANPTISAEFLAGEERRDPEAFKSEYEAMFVGSGGAFFEPDNIAAAVTLPGELRPDDGVDWVAGLDPAFSSDPFGLVIVGRDPGDWRRLLVGLVRSWRPAPRKAVTLAESREVEDAVLAEVAQVIGLFGARAVTDQYKAAGVVDRLRRYGVAVTAEPMTAPTKDAAFGFLRGRLNEASLELYPHEELLRELRAVRTRYAAGRSSVVLPRIGGSHCDHAQALAIAVFAHDRYGVGPPVRARLSRGSSSGGSRPLRSGHLGQVGVSGDAARLAAIFNLAEDQVFDASRRGRGGRAR